MRYVFGDCTLDLQRQELWRAGHLIALRPKVFQLLAYLLLHQERVVPKAELLEQLWAGQFVGDATLNSCLKELRHAVGDTGSVQRVIHTLRSRGYRFVAEAALPPELPPGTRAPHAASTSTETVKPPHDPPAIQSAADEDAVLPGPTTSPVCARTLVEERKYVTILACGLTDAPARAVALGGEGMHAL